MSKKTSRLYVLMSLFCSFIAMDLLYGAVPMFINYQGRLRESGQPVSDTKSINFKIYTVDTGGAEIWSSGAQNIFVSTGMFNYQLGAHNSAAFQAIDWSANTYWLEIVVGVTALAPRERLVAVPYALLSSKVDGQGAFATKSTVGDTDIDAGAVDGGTGGEIADGTITSADLAAGAVGLADMANLAANSIMGNNTAGAATPLALTAAQVKTLLSIDNVQNTSLSTWAGSTSLNTFAADAVDLTEMANLAANSIMGNNTGSPSNPLALTAAQVKTLLSLSNVENTALSTWTGSTSLATFAADSVGLSEMANLAAYSMIGNNTASATNPIALSSASVRSLLNLNNVENTALSTWTGSANLTTFGANSVALAEMATLPASTIIGNSTAGAATPDALTVAEVKTLLSLSNVQNTALTTWTGSTSITTLGTIATGTVPAANISGLGVSLSGGTYYAVYAP